MHAFADAADAAGDIRGILGMADDQASLTTPFSTSTSIFRWPSIRVMGSITIRCAMF